MNKTVILQASEWFIMDQLWEESPKTITQLYHLLKVTPGWSKSTVNTMLVRMVQKEIIAYEEGKKAKLYYPLVKKEDVILAETENLLERIYHGSFALMMSTFVKKQKLSKEELKELQNILDEAGENDD